ncbi:Fic family protein [Dokdonella soli]|uniref:Fic family protein n=1 Tax=Dokdonella soli TaxID=529810 RepID=A0ABP3TKZ3_9GAMM
MKLPVAPPAFDHLLKKFSGSLDTILGRRIGPEVDGVYEPWDHLRHLEPPGGLLTEQWWLAIKLARIPIFRDLPLRDGLGRPILLAVTDSMLRRLHFIDREAAGAIKGLDRADGPGDRERYLFRSLVEEAMTSSQLEGASTTRQVAKEMLDSGRQPRDRSERMIYNNFQVMQQLRRWREQPLTPKSIFEMHRVLTSDAIDEADAAGRFRRADEQIQVINTDGKVLHQPPPADELPARLDALCAFANEADKEDFLHPVLRAIALHFQVGYDHPFVDGNGRTARALFYWSMLRSGYWLTEYLSISSVLKRAPAKYARAYLHTETDESDLGYFVSHQLGVICQAVEGLQGYLARKATEQRQAASLLRPDSALAIRLNHRQRELLLHAVRHAGAIYRIAEHRSTHQVTYQTARTDLLGLVAEGLLRQRKQGKAFAFVTPPDLAKRLQR